MTKKNWLLILLLVALAATYAVYFTDWFRPKTIKIFYTCRNVRQRFQAANGLPGRIFGLNRMTKLTEITVVPLAAWQTNTHVLPLWHLVATSNSVPRNMFFYGEPMRGLKPAVPGAQPEPLETNVVYRLFLTAGKLEGQVNFELK